MKIDETAETWFFPVADNRPDPQPAAGFPDRSESLEQAERAAWQVRKPVVDKFTA
jgi:hypothetical protein